MSRIMKRSKARMGIDAGTQSMELHTKSGVMDGAGYITCYRRIGVWSARFIYLTEKTETLQFSPKTLS
jgi:hypothetical protein